MESPPQPSKEGAPPSSKENEPNHLTSETDNEMEKVEEQEKEGGEREDTEAWERGLTIRVGNFKLKSGERLLKIPDSSALLGEPDLLKKAIQRDGYVLLRGVLDPKKVFGARQVVVNALDQEWKVVDTKAHDVKEAKIRGTSKGFLLTGYRPITHHKDVLSVLENSKLVNLFEDMFKGTATTFHNKWVRVQSTGQFTDEHSDFYRFAHCSEDLYVCWIPLGDYTPLHGTLAVCDGSHKLPGYDKSVDLKSELPEDFEIHQKDAVWRTSSFKAGDILIMDIRTIHASTQNTTQEFRISMDTRWQPAKVQKGNHLGFKVFSPVQK